MLESNQNSQEIHINEFWINNGTRRKEICVSYSDENNEEEGIEEGIGVS